MNRLIAHRYSVLFFTLALIPIAWIALDFASGQLTADPIREIQLRTGRYALILLVISLACTPLYRLFHHKAILNIRRLSGLFAVTYASLHLLNFLWLDYGFNFTFIQQDISEKRFILAGLAAFLCLIPLTITSTRVWKKRLGYRWKRLHRLVYPAAFLAVLHFIWLVKLDIRVPIIFAVLVALLLTVRVSFVHRILNKITRMRYFKD